MQESPTPSPEEPMGITRRGALALMLAVVGSALAHRTAAAGPVQEAVTTVKPDSAPELSRAEFVGYSHEMTALHDAEAYELLSVAVHERHVVLDSRSLLSIAPAVGVLAYDASTPERVYMGDGERWRLVNAGSLTARHAGHYRGAAAAIRQS